MAEGKFVSYLRVSTTKQGQSGLGLEAQREAVSSYLNGGGWELLEEFIDVETGKGSNALDRRPQLKAAMDKARREKATLIIAKLDRLSRDVGFIDGIMKSRVPFVAADMPQATNLTLHIMAAFAEHEREMVSVRTKAAMSAAKARGTILGANGAKLAQINKAEAKARLEPVMGALLDLKSKGLSLRGVADALNAQGLASPGGGKWYAANVKRALARI